jgi:hypothetical protein
LILQESAISPSLKSFSASNSRQSEAVIHEEEEDEDENPAGKTSKMTLEETRVLSKEEVEAKRKGIRDFIFKSEHNLAGLPNN